MAMANWRISTQLEMNESFVFKLVPATRAAVRGIRMNKFELAIS